MYPTVRTAIVLAAALAATPVAARAAAAPSLVPDKTDPARFCANATPGGGSVATGSILKHRVCKTRAQWEADGVKFERRQPMTN